ncbi:hypothetical protein [Aliihoeflea sp. PC F10.4]
MSRRRRVGRVKIDFSEIEKMAAKVLPEVVLGRDRELGWVLSRKSSLHRRKDGTYTLSLIWKSGPCMSLHSTVRGIRFGAA